MKETVSMKIRMMIHSIRWLVRWVRTPMVVEAAGDADGRAHGFVPYWDRL